LYTPTGINEATDSLQLELTLFGRAIEYYPYMYQALIRAGEKGLFRERVRYSISELAAQDNEVKTGKWTFSNDSEKRRSSLEIKFITPVRIKIKGRYTEKFSAIDFFNTSWRRAAQVTALYGKCGERFSYFPPNDVSFESKEIKWIDLERWSSRQRSKMKLGGFVGSLYLCGELSSADMSILRFNEIFHMGKNTGFGLGKVRVE